MNINRTGAGALAAAILLLTSACGGGGGGGRPSTDQIASALQKSGDNSLLGSTGSQLSDDQANCLAKVLHDSGVSDAALRALIKNDNSYKPSAADERAARSMVPQFAKCVPQATN
jgi:hypothetical protein